MKRTHGFLALLALCTCASSQAEPLVNGLGMSFLPVPAGSFLMGTADLDEAIFEQPAPDPDLIRDETPAHEVTVTQAFYLGKTEVTQGQWLDLMGSKPGPTEYWNREDWKDLPVVSVTWFQVQEFIDALNQREAPAHYRLPTEAEWEYAARAGTNGLRPFPLEALREYAWFRDNSDDEPKPVATLKPNAWGFYDLLGNAWEWVADWYSPQTYANLPAQDPQGPGSGEKKVRRGGSYHCQPHLVRPAYRAIDIPQQAYSVLGFRLVREMDQ